MIRIFIGYDRLESVAYHVLCHSILSRASEPVSITPVGNSVLPKDIWWRPRGPKDSTEFSNARFIIPALCEHDGWALFMDCDQLCLDDAAKLWALRDPKYAVMVVKQIHTPLEMTKFLGHEQTRYKRKNWSSLMLINCSHPSTEMLTAEAVNHADGLYLHQFKWCQDAEIGELPEGWNMLVGTGVATDVKERHLHYTMGGPWHGYTRYGYSQAWLFELERMLAGDNPCATIGTSLHNRGFTLGGSFNGVQPSGFERDVAHDGSKAGGAYTVEKEKAVEAVEISG